MAKELPYFKFNVSEWLNGDITLEKYNIQGVFINICAFYWHKQGEVTIDWLKQRLTFASDEIDLLLSKGFLLEQKPGSKISIKFLKEQQNELTELSEARSAAGRKGGEASVKQRLSKRSTLVKHLDKDKDKDNIGFASAKKSGDYSYSGESTPKPWNNPALSIQKQNDYTLLDSEEYYAKYPEDKPKTKQQ